MSLPPATQRTVLALWVAILFGAGTLAQPTPDASSRTLFLQRLVNAAIERSHHAVRYEPAYVGIPYPGGDVPADTGVCTDEIIRTYRVVGIDLQKEVHEDIVANPAAYPHKWKWLLRKPDTNIDHRRVPNLMVFFQRKGETLAITKRAEDYNPGDLVTYDLGGGVPHIGIVIDQKGTHGAYMILHNIGQGPKIEDVLFRWKITGHYRYYGSDHFSKVQKKIFTTGDTKGTEENYSGSTTDENLVSYAAFGAVDSISCVRFQV